MPRLRAALALVFALSLSTAESAFPQSAALEVDGWERSVAATGTIYYRCRAQACAGATVSYRDQQGMQIGTLDALRAQHETINQRMIAAGQGIARVETIDASEEEIAGARAQIVVKALEFVDGRRQAMAAGVVTNGSRLFSIVSTAPSQAAARANLQTFVPVVMLSGHTGGKPPPR